MKVRKQGSVAGHLQVWLETSRFHGPDRYFPARGIRMETPTASTPELLAAARLLLEKMFREAIDYRKAGCLLTDLQSAATAQLTLFDDPVARKRSAAVTALVEALTTYPDELQQLEVVDSSIGNTKTKDDPHLPNPTTYWWDDGEMATNAG